MLLHPDNIINDDEQVENEIIRLNVGGKIFETTRKTLQSVQNTYLTGILVNHHFTLKDTNGCIFIDRDPLYFSIILQFLRTKKLRRIKNVQLRDLLLEAEFYSITPIVELIQYGLGYYNPKCGSTLYNGYLRTPTPIHNDTFIDKAVYLTTINDSLLSLPDLTTLDNTSLASNFSNNPSNKDRLVSNIVSNGSLVCASSKYEIFGYLLQKFEKWELVFNSPSTKDNGPIRNIALSNKVESYYIVAYSTDCQIQIYKINMDKTNKNVATIDIKNSKHLFFIQSQLVSINDCGKINFWSSRQNVVKSQELSMITCIDVSDKLVLFGCKNGDINYINMELFPIRIEDEDLMISNLFHDDNDEEITALSYYCHPIGSSDYSVGNWIEIAYGTISGLIKLVVQRPETAGYGIVSYKSFKVHNYPITKIALTDRHLISVCCHSNHVRTWSLTRFRNLMSTQPGPLAFASFNVIALNYANQDSSSMNIGPYGYKNLPYIFIQRIQPNDANVRILNAANGEVINQIVSVDGSPITAFCQFIPFFSTSRVDEQTSRVILTGHLNGSIQIWELSKNNPNFIEDGEQLEKRTWQIIENFDESYFKMSNF